MVNPSGKYFTKKQTHQSEKQTNASSSCHRVRLYFGKPIWHRRVIACVCILVNPSCKYFTNCILVNPSCKYFTKIQTHQSSRRQLTPNFGRIFGPRAWATLSSFGCNLPGPGVIVPKTRQFLGPRYISWFKHLTNSPKCPHGLGNVIIIWMQFPGRYCSEKSTIAS